MGEMDKASLRLAGRTFLDRALDAVAAASSVILVGPGTSPRPGLEVVQEEPPGGGPAAGIAAGIELVSAELVVVLAIDYPFVDASVVGEIVTSVGAADGCVLRDDGGREQPLAGCYRSERLRSSLRALPAVHGASVQAALEPLTLNGLTRMPAAFDCDSTDDLAVLERLASSERPST
jgi:molybdopterin-guanine dinucleotide biosynthesis protein A